MKNIKETKKIIRNEIEELERSLKLDLQTWENGTKTNKHWEKTFILEPKERIENLKNTLKKIEELEKSETEFEITLYKSGFWGIGKVNFKNLKTGQFI